MQRLNPSPALSAWLVNVRVDVGALGFTAALVLGTGLIGGLLPSFHARRTSFASALRSESRGASLGRAGLRWQQAMVIVQSAVAVLILTGATLAAVGFARLSQVRLGFQAEQRAAFQIQFPEPAYATHEKRAEIIQRLEQNLAREPADLVWQATALPRLQTALLGAFALVAVGITALGSYGVMSQLVSSRRRELAIRSALGADRAGVLRLVLWSNARLALAGSAVGLMSATLACHWLEKRVTGFEAGHVWPYLAVLGLVLLLTQVASFVPARRAARCDTRAALFAT